ncbi:hypothetical protein [Streptomyces sp. SID13588]|uniref:hypothetical protein n=1 Tax=Streptomyces sp. SID13588 TaxID=2706051 RepID=UPI0013CD4F67|nr:hypothetical protein [Streptomyces sp. SID13588]NEA72026.1 hypothetical protein [Streptomyces sp. SID13588]
MKRFLRLLLALVMLTAGLLAGAAPASAASCSQRSESHTDPNTGQSWSSVSYCGNDSGAPLYAGANNSTLVGWMDSTNSWFSCYRHGQQHAGGNDVWYYTQGDRSASGWQGRQAWGFMPAVNLWTSTDPSPGVPPCAPDMWQSNESQTDYAGQYWPADWYSHSRAGAALYAGPDASTTVGYMDSTTSWFVCYAHGAQHAGGNDVWYYTQGDRVVGGQGSRRAWGYMPAVDVSTRQDPYDSIPACSGGSTPPGGTIPVGDTTTTTPPKPATDRSFYVQSMDNAMADGFGCTQANLDVANSVNYVKSSYVIFAFGGQTSNGSGTQLPGLSTIVSNSAIESYVEAYATGYHRCVRPVFPDHGTHYPFVNIGIGTNNDITVTAATGRAWAGVVNDVDNWLRARSGDIGSTAQVDGANDMEPGFSGSIAATRAWVQAFHDSTYRLLTNFGSADGCPVSMSTDTRVNHACNNGWSMEDIYWISQGVGRASAEPEIYNSDQPKQWALISRYGATAHASGCPYVSGCGIPYIGVWDHHATGDGTNTATTAWNLMWQYLGQDSRTAMVPAFSMEICYTSQVTGARSPSCQWS